jgi:hypothetical protein
MRTEMWPTTRVKSTQYLVSSKVEELQADLQTKEVLAMLEMKLPANRGLVKMGRVHSGTYQEGATLDESTRKDLPMPEMVHPSS